MKIYFDEKAGRWRRKNGTFAAKEEVKRYTRANFDIKVTMSPNEIESIKEARQQVWYYNVVIPFAEKHGYTEEEALRRITELRNQQYFTYSELDEIQDYWDLYNKVF